MKNRVLLIGILVGFCLNIFAQTTPKLIAIESIQKIEIKVNQSKEDIENQNINEKENILNTLQQIEIITKEIHTDLDLYGEKFKMEDVAVSLKSIETNFYNIPHTLANLRGIYANLRGIKDIVLGRIDEFLTWSPSRVSEENNYNYIKTRTYTSADVSQYLDQIQYFDGLGRPNALVMRKITPDPDPKDLVSFIKYDVLGRKFQQWLPAKINQNNGYFVDFNSFESGANSFYSDSRPYIENDLEKSPLSRILGQTGAGTDWASNPTEIQYLANTASEVPYFEVVNNQLRRNGFYNVNTLYKTVSIDEDGKIATEYKDKLGRVVMTSQAYNHKTCYVYDDFGLLRYVLPPMAVDDNSKLHEYAYIYEYDERGNQISKKLPGCKPIFMVYDKANRLVLSQNGNQRKNDPTNTNKYWTASTYDIFGRVLYSCEIINNSDHNELLSYYKTRLVVESFNDAQPFGYTTNHFPNYDKMLIINYYDSYNFLNLLNSNVATALTYEENSDYGARYANAKTLLTGTRAYIFDGTDEFLATAFYYDAKGRVVQQRATNYLSGFDIVYNKYNFVGAVTSTLKEHSTSPLNPPQGDLVSEHYTNEYDHAQRLTKTEYSLNGSTPIVIAENTYDDLGRLIEKKRHSNTDIEEFEYNIKNWLTKIQSGSFVQELFYNTGNNPNYNGNISKIAFQNHTYDFIYDGLNRLTDGISSNGFDEFFGYQGDKHGNIKKLKRYSNGTLIDDLVLEYDGNQLQKVKDAAGGANLYDRKEYQDKANENVEMYYDDNGNLTKDLDRKISLIEYNILNLPIKIVFENGHVIANVYAADSRKLASIYVTQMAGNINPMQLTLNDILYNPAGLEDVNGTFYVGNFEYLFDNQVFNDLRIHNAEGYYQNGSLYYYRKDHLGNNREVWNATQNQTVQVTNYYPSGLVWVYEDEHTPAVQPYKYNGKEFIEMYGLDEYDSQARYYYPAIARTTTPDPLAEIYYSTSPYAWCANNFVRFIDPTGMAWRPTYNQDREGNRTYNGYEWIPEDQSYDENGNLLAGLYHQAVFFSDNGTFDPNSGKNMGSSTATVYLADGNTTTFDACTYPSNLDKYATVPEGLYEAVVGLHFGVSSLLMRDIGITRFTIETGVLNPAYSDGRTYITRADIHYAGKKNFTGEFWSKRLGRIAGVSEACFLIDVNRFYNEFMPIFNSSTQKNNVVSITTSRTLSSPINTTTIFQTGFRPATRNNPNIIILNP